VRVRDDPQSLRFSGVRRIPREQWPVNWLKGGCQPGDLLLTAGRWGVTGGLLCLTKTGRFMTLTPRQVFDGAAVPWPEPGSYFSIRLIGDRVELELKKSPKAPDPLWDPPMPS